VAVCVCLQRTKWERESLDSLGGCMCPWWQRRVRRWPGYAFVYVYIVRYRSCSPLSPRVLIVA